jgi:hypothetical protein
LPDNGSSKLGKASGFSNPPNGDFLYTANH